MVPFAGFEMPVQYTGVNEEHRCVREGVGFRCITYGTIFSLGPNAFSLIQKYRANYFTVTESTICISSKY